MTDGNDRSILVWDLPTRLFHWLLAGAVLAAWLTGEADALLAWHVFFGTAVLLLIPFRLVWGILGSLHARFSNFIQPWPVVRHYLLALLQRKAPRYIGHNPAAGWAIVLLMTLSFLTALLGFASIGGEEQRGPLATLLSYWQGKLFGELHEGLANGLMALVIVHLTGVIVGSLVHRENLIAAMLHGRKIVNDRDEPVAIIRPYRAVAILPILLLLLAAWQTPRLLATTPLVQNDSWNRACSDCHLPFHPSLLPRDSWLAMLEPGAAHFGDILALDAATTETLKQFVLAHGAGSGSMTTGAGNRIVHSIAAGKTPWRIIETPYWLRKHRKIKDSLWNHHEVRSKVRCEACHKDARTGLFEKQAIQMPQP
ncbi:MAG: cytochrome b/b6 domain-containing protein [Magnetococcales bacterium]|nr:cytochrome b/b6 domain-containing protein [Magnetococcales bacterium]